MVAIVDLMRGFKMIVGRMKSEEEYWSECIFCKKYERH